MVAAVTVAVPTAAGGGGEANAAMAGRGVVASAIRTLTTAGPAQRTRTEVAVARFTGHLLAHEPRLEHRDRELRARTDEGARDRDGGAIEDVPRPQRFVADPRGDGTG